MYLDSRYIRYFDFKSFFLMLAITIIGVMSVLSATYRTAEPFSLFFIKQAIGAVVGIGIYLICCCIDYRSLMRWGYFFYYIILMLLAFTMVLGTVKLGGQRWINLGFIKFQPSEFAKILFAPYVVYYLSTEKNTAFTFKTFMPLLGFMFLAFILILKQPDLGTALIVLFSGITLLWIAGIGRTFFYTAAFCSIIMAPVGWRVLKPYQQKRILVFLGQGDKRKERYQIEQSKIAIGSGGTFGKGYLRGTQNKLQFLPEGRTDFIFSVFCEEWGFLGALILLMLYVLLFSRLFTQIADLKNMYALLLAAGLVLPLVFATIINICMVTGLLPIVGIPLPFMTYGISHLWMSFIALGFVQSIMMRRFFIT